jgi:hypothetical protein
MAEGKRHEGKTPKGPKKGGNNKRAKGKIPGKLRVTNPPSKVKEKVVRVLSVEFEPNPLGQNPDPGNKQSSPLELHMLARLLRSHKAWPQQLVDLGLLR